MNILNYHILFIHNILAHFNIKFLSILLNTIYLYLILINKYICLLLQKLYSYMKKHPNNLVFILLNDLVVIVIVFKLVRNLYC